MPSIHSIPDSKADIFIEKYKIVHQRTARHKIFATPAIGTETRSSTYSLKAIEQLLGFSSKENNVIVLGMLTQLKEASNFQVLIYSFNIQFSLVLAVDFSPPQPKSLSRGSFS